MESIQNINNEQCEVLIRELESQVSEHVQKKGGGAQLQSMSTSDVQKSFRPVRPEY